MLCKYYKTKVLAMLLSRKYTKKYYVLSKTK